MKGEKKYLFKKARIFFYGHSEASKLTSSRRYFFFAIIVIANDHVGARNYPLVVVIGRAQGRLSAQPRAQRT